MWEMYLLAFLAPVLVLALPVMVATWGRWQWGVLDLLVLPSPGAFWIFLISVYGGGGRSLSNVVELPLLALATAALAWLKGPLQSHLPPALRRSFLGGAAMLVSIAFYLVFPRLEE
jgi:hypothetical protein